MRVDVHKDKDICRFYKTFDVDTNEEIQDCVWSDDESGEYCIYVRDENGNIERQWGNPEYRHLPLELFETKENKKYGGIVPRTIIKKGNIKLVDMRQTINQ